MSRLLSTLMIAAALTTPAMAQDRMPNNVVVSLQGVDLHSPAEAKAFYQKLRRVSQEACNSGYDYLFVKLSDGRCAREALAKAVRSVNEPLVYLAAGQAPPDVQVASASK